jgi:hypothetical protein
MVVMWYIRTAGVFSIQPSSPQHHSIWGSLQKWDSHIHDIVLWKSWHAAYNKAHFLHERASEYCCVLLCYPRVLMGHWKRDRVSSSGN